MADYYPLIARAVASLPEDTETARRALYERARNALANQLRGQTPAFSQSQVTQERESLEEAIRRVETEAGDASKKAGFWKKLFGPGAAKSQDLPKPVAPKPSTAAPSRDGEKISRVNAPSLMRAATLENPAELRRMIASGSDVNEADGNGVTALMLAAMLGRAACVRALIQAHAVVDAKDHHGHTALFHAAIQGKNLDCVKALIDAGADADTPLRRDGYYLSSAVAEIDAVIKAARDGARDAGVRSKPGMSQPKSGSRATPAILSGLLKQDWFLVPTGDALAQSDEQTKQLSSTILGNYKGWLCALCQTVRCDQTSTILVNVTDRKADGNSEFQPVAICEKCMATHTEGEIIAMGKAGKLCNAVTVANQPQPQEQKLTFYEMNPPPVGVVLETEPRRMIRIGETLDSMRVYIGEPLYKGTASEWGKLSGAIEIYCYPGGGVFKVPMALIFADGKLATFADYKDS